MLILLFFLYSSILFAQTGVSAKSFLVKPSVDSSEVVLISQDATKRVLVPHEDIGNEWRENLGYNDSSWQLCEGQPGGIGYEKDSGYEDLITLDVTAEMHSSGGNPNPSCYIRIPFSIDSTILSKLIFMQLKIRYDDGFKVFLNENLVAEANAPATETWNSFASENHEAKKVTEINISSYKHYLTPGNNLLTIQGMNDNNRSSDFLITAELVASDILYGDFTSSNLPIFHIYTNGQEILDEPKINATMRIINNGKGRLNHPSDLPNDYDGNIGIEIRGAYSATFPLVSYGIETRDSLGENLNVSVLGMPKENDWALVANYNEKSFVRNSLSYDLFRAMGHYAARTKLCEVFINDNYQGIYLFSEKIKRNKNRVSIAKLKIDDNAGDSLTGGYIIKNDKATAENSWLSNFHPPGHPDWNVHFLYYYPKPDKITSEQKTYIQSYIDSTQTALFGEQFYYPELGYRKYIDVLSFIDYFIISELSRNLDAYHKSRNYYKDKKSNGGLLHAGPVWDFDWAWKDIGSTVRNGEGWVYDGLGDINQSISPGWYIRLLQDGYFTNKLINRYTELRTNILSFDYINAYIDSVAAHVGSANDHHFKLWPIDEGYIAQEPLPYPKTYDEQITRLKNWIQRRVNWLDSNLPKLQNKIIVNVSSDDLQYLPSTAYLFNNYPNPFNPKTTIRYTIPNVERFAKSIKNNVTLKIFDILGKEVATLVNQKQKPGSYKVNFNATSLPSGIYFYTLQSGTFSKTKKLILMK